MTRLSRLLSLVLFTVWFPVTQHCNLEAAGLIAKQCVDDCLPGQIASDDGCALVENSAYKSGITVVKAPVPDLFACACHFYLQLLSVPWDAAREIAPTSGASFERPQDWVSVWHFVRRAAPAPRAPSLSVA